jgi:prepilin-type N-terminal cleavage/methylation domain-containing protein
MNLPRLHFRRTCCSGMSLIEIMVAMFLLTVIMLGLFAAFYQTQRAFRLSASQTDVLEGGRSTLSLLVRELQELTTSGQSNGLNMTATELGGGVKPPFPLTTKLSTYALDDLFFLTHRNDQWTGVGYFISMEAQGAGTLYRFTTNATDSISNRLASFYTNFLAATPTTTNVGRVAEGIVHLSVRAFDTNGIEYAPGQPFATSGTNDVMVATKGFDFAFANRMLPAFLDVELGMIDGQVYRQFKVISSNSPVNGKLFLENQAGKVYLFRQRIPIRNHHEP